MLLYRMGILDCTMMSLLYPDELGNALSFYVEDYPPIFYGIPCIFQFRRGISLSVLKHENYHLSLPLPFYMPLCFFLETFDKFPPITTCYFHCTPSLCYYFSKLFGVSAISGKVHPSPAALC